MKNVSDTQAYTVFDHLFLKALRTVSRVVSVKDLTQPFWGRWRASNVDETVLFQFLKSISSLDDWPIAAQRMAEAEGRAFAEGRDALGTDRQVSELRRLSYLCNLGQWGILPLGAEKQSIYQLSRDYYLAAESLAHGEDFRRIAIEWRGATFRGNLHCRMGTGRAQRLIVIVHGLDDCKEEHLATELALFDAGFAVVSFDGPGQGEALLLEGHVWDENFHTILTSVIDAVGEVAPIDERAIGSVGFSIGSLWSIRGAAQDRRIKAVYDLGAPINTKAFGRVPFLIKSRMCQITGARTQAEIDAVLAKNFIDRPEILATISAAVRIIHGARDRVVAMDDKIWLRDEFNRLGISPDVSMRIFDDGDHCCTNNIPEIRRDMAIFFSRTLAPPVQSVGEKWEKKLPSPPPPEPARQPHRPPGAGG